MFVSKFHIHISGKFHQVSLFIPIAVGEVYLELSGNRSFLGLPFPGGHRLPAAPLPPPEGGRCGSISLETPTPLPEGLVAGKFGTPSLITLLSVTGEQELGSCSKLSPGAAAPLQTRHPSPK